MSNICVIYNPAARSDRVRARLAKLERLVAGATLRPSKSAGHASDLAVEAAGDGFQTVVACGGDGTINEVLNGLMRIPAENRPKLGVLPMGTANVYARDLGLPLNAAKAWEVIQAGQYRSVDVGLAQAANGDQRHFVQLAGAGFDALAIAALDLELKKRIHWLAYVVSGLRLLKAPLPRLTVTAGDQKLEGHFAFIGNGRYYGGPFTLFPNMQLDDNELGVCVFQGQRLRDVLRYLHGVLRGVHTDFHDVRYAQAKRLTVDSTPATPLQVDGELWGTSPAEFSIQAKALRVLVHQKNGA